MAEEQKCRQCGAELPANAPGGVCPKCVMKLGLPTGADPEKPPSQDDQNAVPTSATPPGGFVPPEPAELNEKLPGLEIIELLGQGGMGAVYKARQKQLDRIVALKVLPIEISKDPTFAERFTREARSLARSIIARTSIRSAWSSTRCSRASCRSAGLICRPGRSR